MTQDIKLPPLPVPVVENYPSGRWSFHTKQMFDYGLACYRAAIEADRKRRGEQRVIGRIKLDGNRHPRAELSTGYDENGNQWKEGTPIYSAPQPKQMGEPVAWPLASKEEADIGWILDYLFLEQVEKVASQRTDFTTSMEATEQVLIAAAELLRPPQPAEPVIRESRNTAEPVKLECPKCGVDRAKEPCAGNLMDCEFKGVAHAAEPVKPARDWTEDATHENGNYQCKCVYCGEFFVGHKRRAICKICTEPVKVQSFDDWFKERNSGLSFDEAHMGDGALIDKSMKELSRHMRDYVTELVNAKP